MLNNEMHLFIPCSFQKDLKCLIGVDQIVEEQDSISDMGSDKAQTYERTLYVWEMAMKSEGRHKADLMVIVLFLKQWSLNLST